MSSNVIQVVIPFQLFTDLDGEALENGNIYIGEANKDPETNPITVYWDSGLTIPASQPITTLNGYLSQSGTPGRLFVDSDYSITVKDEDDVLVFTALSSVIEQEIVDLKSFENITVESGGSTIETLVLSENSGAIIEIYAAGLKSTNMSILKNKFSLYRTTGPITISNIYSDELRDGDDTDVYFDVIQDVNNALIKAFTVSGTWTASGQIRIITSGTVSFL